MAPTEVVGVPAGWNPCATQQSGIVGPSGAWSRTVLAQSTKVVACPTVPVNTPSRVETKQAFDEVSSALRTVSSKHKEVRADMQGLASGVEELRRARASDVETIAQVQATLQRTLFASSSLEMRLGQTEEQQTRARICRQRS